MNNQKKYKKKYEKTTSKLKGLSVFNILKSLIIAVLFLLSVNIVYSATGANVVLSSQNPDPVTPGNFVFLNVKVSNSGERNIQEATIEMIENTNFKIAQGSDKYKNLGIIPAFSSLESSKNFVIAKFKVFVNENTPLGLNTVKFVLNDGNTDYEYEFNVLVQDTNPSVIVSDFKVNVIEAGKSDKLFIEITNDNSITLQDIILSLDLDEVDDKVLSIEGGSNQKVISILEAGEKIGVEFDLVVSPDADSKPYLLPIKIDYEDALGNSFTSEGFGSIRVDSKPQLSLKLDSQDKYTKGKIKGTFAIANPGTSTIKGTQVEILESDSYTIIEGDFQYVGDLNPDDFQTIQAEIFIKDDVDTNNVNLKFKLKYLDSYNNENEDIVEIPLKVFSQDELNMFGLEGGKSSGGNTSMYVIVLILLVVVFFVGRRFGYNKSKKTRRN